MNLHTVSIVAAPFSFPPTGHKVSLFSTPSPTFVIFKRHLPWLISGRSDMVPNKMLFQDSSSISAHHNSCLFLIKLKTLQASVLNLAPMCHDNSCLPFQPALNTNSAPSPSLDSIEMKLLANLLSPLVAACTASSLWNVFSELHCTNFITKCSPYPSQAQGLVSGLTPRAPCRHSTDHPVLRLFAYVSVAFMVSSPLPFPDPLTSTRA